MKELVLLAIIGGVMGLFGLIIRGVTSFRQAIVEWLASVIVAIIVGWAIKDYITSQSLYNASVATGSLFGIYIVRGVEKIMRGFSDDPCGMIGRLRGRGDDKDVK